jgi:hypothetical protein
VAQKAIQYITYDPRISKNTLNGLQENKVLLQQQKKLSKGDIDIAKTMNLSFLNKTLDTHPEYFKDLKPTELVH